MAYTMMDRMTDLLVLAVCFAPGMVAMALLAKRAEREAERRQRRQGGRAARRPVRVR